jgi:predicted nucleotidyltransferase
MVCTQTYCAATPRRHQRAPPCARRKVVAFGSRARRQALPFSDLDLALIGSGPIRLSTPAALEHDLSELDRPYRVNLVNWPDTDGTTYGALYWRV